MKPQAFQYGELRDANDTIIRDGTYGKKTPCEQSMFSIFDVTNYL